jgi:hypothetical protein
MYKLVNLLSLKQIHNIEIPFFSPQNTEQLSGNQSLQRRWFVRTNWWWNLSSVRHQGAIHMKRRSSRDLPLHTWSILLSLWIDLYHIQISDTTDWIWNIWTVSNVVKTHADGTGNNWKDESNQKGVYFDLLSFPLEIVVSHLFPKYIVLKSKNLWQDCHIL